MKVEIEIAGRTRAVEWTRSGDAWRCALDGLPLDADALEISPGNFSILLNGHSCTVHVEETGETLRVLTGPREFVVTIRDPRLWRRNRSAAAQAEGRQNVLASMPGKVVRVLAKAGDSVKAGQGLLVVEAMKMQNEIRSPKSGTIERLLVSEGQAVNAGELLAIVG
ncbi:MAG TPA: biotin/lipoyl-containing protein [Candidatus Acidoferrales bacterium]|jgi:biotin carboxyl carrier protein